MGSDILEDKNLLNYILPHLTRLKSTYSLLSEPQASDLYTVLDSLVYCNVMWGEKTLNM
jgi:hypothetical protein